MPPDAAARQAAQLQQATSRVMSFGQDTSRLHARANGKKAWRAEVPADVEEKDEGAAALAKVRKELQLASVRLGVLHAEHVAKLTARLEEVSAQQRHVVAEKIRLAKAAEARRLLMAPVYSEILSLPGCVDFISYVHGRAHGEQVQWRTKPRAAPYPRGAVPGKLCSPLNSPGRAWPLGPFFSRADHPRTLSVARGLLCVADPRAVRVRPQHDQVHHAHGASG